MIFKRIPLSRNTKSFSASNYNKQQRMIEKLVHTDGINDSGTNFSVQRQRQRHFLLGYANEIELTLLQVKVRQHTVTYGSATTGTNHTYDLFPFDKDITEEEILAEDINVLGRPALGRVFPAPNGSLAIAGYTIDKEDPYQSKIWIIFALDEKMSCVVCNAAG